MKYLLAVTQYRRMSASALCLFLVLNPYALALDDQSAVRREVESGVLKPLAEILAELPDQHPGRVLGVELEDRRDGQRVYEIELISPDGQLQELHVDARSGAVLDRAGDTAGLLPLLEIVRQVLDRYPGRIVSIDLDRHQYDMGLVLESGAQLHIVIDGRTGAIVDDPPFGEGSADEVTVLELLQGLAMTHPGTVVELELERDQSGRQYYEVDIRDREGRMLELRLDARTGQLMTESDA